MTQRSRAETLDEGARSGSRVLVLDGGEPRNVPVEASHGFFTRDGIHPGEMLKIGREQLEQYPDVEYRAGRATEVSGADSAFEVVLGGGKMVAARKLVLAPGYWTNCPSARPPVSPAPWAASFPPRCPR